MTKSGMTYSHSRLETFESCRLKFKFQYVDKVEVPKRDSIEAFLGSRVHDTLEALYKGVLNGKLWTRDELVKFYTDLWEKEKNNELHIVNKQYTEQDYLRQGVTALEKYWDRYYPFTSEKTIALEKRIQVYLDDGKEFKLQGFIDRISKSDDGTWHIRDYKTKRNLPTLAEANMDRQLALYQIGLQSMWENTEKVELIWHYLLFDEEIKSVRERSDLERLKIETIHVIQEVETAIEKDDFPYNESALCDWCDFFDICPAKKHLAVVQKLTPKEFKQDEGVMLADQYSSLENEKDRIKLQLAEVEARMEALEQDIYNFATQFGVDKIYGSNRRLSVWKKDTFKAPSSDTKDEKLLREQLEQLLKNNKLWEQVSQLNSARLIKLYENEELPKYLQDQLRQYMTEITRRRIYTAKIKDYDENFEG